MRISTAATVAGVSTAALAATLVSGPASAGPDDRRFAGTSTYAVGLTADQRLVGFDVTKPSKAKKLAKVSGLSGDTKLVGIDYRVQDGKLYGVGDQGGVYRIYPSVGTTTKVSQITVPLAGTAFGVDFNPAADRLRVVSDTGQNLRHDITGGTTITDGFLTYPAPPAPNTQATGIVSSAYTNNDLDSTTATTLFDIDTRLDQVAIQSPANGGSLAATGKLFAEPDSQVGFDIKTRRQGGKAIENTGYAAMTVGGKARLYKIDLLTGQARSLGSFPRYRQVVDLAMPTAR